MTVSTCDHPARFSPCKGAEGPHWHREQGKSKEGDISHAVQMDRTNFHSFKERQNKGYSFVWVGGHHCI